MSFNPHNSLTRKMVPFPIYTRGLQHSPRLIDLKLHSQERIKVGVSGLSPINFTLITPWRAIMER
jgi:hypothetical protein